MKQTKKILGLLIIVFFGIPTLFAIIWAVGFTTAAISPGMLSDVPQKVIDAVPDMVMEILEAVKREEDVFGSNQDRWLRAMSKTDPPVNKIIIETGIYNWLEKELTTSLNSLGEILRGEKETQDVILNLRPLKTAFNHKAFEAYYYKLIEHLPPCDEDDAIRWQELAAENDIMDSLPPCRPKPAIAALALKQIQSTLGREIPNEVPLFEKDWLFSSDISIVKKIANFTYALFIIPVMFILLGSLIAAHSKSSFLKWSGISTLIGGLLPLAISALFQKFALHFVHLGYIYDHDFSTLQIPTLVLDKVEHVLGILTTHLFSPVSKVAGTVCVIGIILFALSFLFAGDSESRQSQNHSHPTPPPRTTEPRN